MCFVLSKYSEIVFTMHSFGSFTYDLNSIMSKCFPGFVCFNKCCGAMNTLSLVSLMSFSSMQCNVWHLCVDINKNSIHNFPDSCINVSTVVFCRYPNTFSTGQVAVYLGKAGRSLNAPFMNLVISSKLLISKLLHIFRNVANADLAVPRDLNCSPELCNCDKKPSTLLISGLMGLMFLPQNLNHFATYTLYCFLVESLHDLRMISLAPLGIFLLLRVFLI